MSAALALAPPLPPEGDHEHRITVLERTVAALRASLPVMVVMGSAVGAHSPELVAYAWSLLATLGAR